MPCAKSGGEGGALEEVAGLGGHGPGLAVAAGAVERLVELDGQRRLLAAVHAPHLAVRHRVRPYMHRVGRAVRARDLQPRRVGVGAHGVLRRAQPRRQLLLQRAERRLAIVRRLRLLHYHAEVEAAGIGALLRVAGDGEPQADVVHEEGRPRARLRQGAADRLRQLEQRRR